MKAGSGSTAARLTERVQEAAPPSRALVHRVALETGYRADAPLLGIPQAVGAEGAASASPEPVGDYALKKVATPTGFEPVLPG